MATAVSVIPADVLEYLGLHHIITLGTSSFTGMPHANTVAYASDANEIYFVTPAGTQVVRNINDNPYVSFTIDDYTTDWRKVRELQGVSRCRRINVGEEPVVLSSFSQKFGVSVEVPDGLMYAMRPIEVHFVDYIYGTVSAALPVASSKMTSRTYKLEDATESGHGAVSTSLKRRTLSPGEVIFRPGDPSGQFYIVLDGEVEVRGEGYGADQTVTRVGVGQMFGDQAMLRGQRGALTAHAVSTITLLAIERDSVRDLLLRPSNQQSPLPGFS